MGPREFRKGKLGKGYDLSVVLTSHWAMFVHCQFVDINSFTSPHPRKLEKQHPWSSSHHPPLKKHQKSKIKTDNPFFGEGFVRVTSSTSSFCCTGFLPQSNEKNIDVLRQPLVVKSHILGQMSSRFPRNLNKKEEYIQFLERNRLYPEIPRTKRCNISHLLF